MSLTTTEARAAIDVLLAREGITMTAAFVPQSLSRHSAEKDRTLNWRITFSNAASKASFAIDYSQGIGHIPAMLGKSYPMERQANEYQASQEGRYQVRANASYQTKPLPPPTAADLLHCLVLDASCAENTFEEWCSELGYDTDSRKAEEIYNQCRKQTRDAMRVLGSKLLADAGTLLQDY